MTSCLKRIGAALSLSLLPLFTALPAVAGIVAIVETVAKDELFSSRFLLTVNLDKFRPVGSYTLIAPFDIGGAHWNVTGTAQFTGTAGFTSELLTLSGTYTHISNPHPGETSNSFFFSQSWNAWDVATDSLGNPDFAGTKTGTVFDVLQTHPGGDHEDRFLASFNIAASNLNDANGPKYFDTAFFDFTASHPIPLPAALPCLLAGLGGLAWLRRRSRG